MTVSAIIDSFDQKGRRKRVPSARHYPFHCWLLVRALCSGINLSFLSVSDIIDGFDKRVNPDYSHLSDRFC